MTTDEQATDTASTPHELIRYRSLIAWVLIVAGKAIIVLGLYLNWLANNSLASELTFPISALLGCFLGGTLLAGVGYFQRFTNNDSAEIATEKFVYMALGSSFGLLLALVGTGLIFEWWQELDKWLRVGQSASAFKPLTAIGLLLVGLFVAFISLAPAQSYERSNANLRRLLHGYTALLNGVLLLIILVITNVAAQIYITRPLDAGQAGFSALAPRSTAILQKIDQQTKLVLIAFSEVKSPIIEDMRKLVLSAVDANPRYISAEFLSPNQDKDKVDALMKTYPSLTPNLTSLGEDEYAGLIVLYGEKLDQFRYLKYSEMIARETDANTGATGPGFGGEDKLLTEISFLTDGLTKRVVYFTQTEATEYDFNDQDARSEEGRGIGLLVNRLKERNYEVRPLQFNLANPKVPDDATMLVIAGPQNPMRPDIVKAIQLYLNPPPESPAKKGKLVVLLDSRPDVTDRNRMAPTGLDELLAEYNIQAPPERVLTVNPNRMTPTPRTVVVTGARAGQQAQHPVSIAYFDGQQYIPLPFTDVRPLKATTTNTQYKVLEVLSTAPRTPVWYETSMQQALTWKAVLEEREQNADAWVQKKRATLEPAAVALFVSEGQPTMPNLPQRGPSAEDKPRLAVFGNSRFVLNTNMRPNAATEPFELMAATLSWLGEKPNTIGIGPKSYRMYKPQNSNLDTLQLLPLGIILLGLAGLGAGVWAVRRQ
jgi:hypothetical protein